MTFRGLALRHSEWRNRGLCVCVCFFYAENGAILFQPPINHPPSPPPLPPFCCLMTSPLPGHSVGFLVRFLAS